jgi:uncharacterized protein YbjT (DUF2867 family)
MRLAIFGATGPLGQELVKQAGARGHEMRLLSRRDIPGGDVPAGATVIRGDYFAPVSLRETLRGVDAVLSTIGPPQHRKTALTPDDFAKGMRQLVQEMQAANLTRLINVASTGTRLGSEPYGIWRRLFRGLLRFIAPVVIPGKEAELRVLSQSGLRWTTIRPPILKPGRGGTVRASATAPQGIMIDTSVLAGFMLDQLRDETWVGKAPFVGS